MFKNQLTRRTLLQVGTLAIVAPSLLSPACPEAELIDLDDFTPAGDPSEWSASALARFAAAWELSAQQKNQPAGWRSLCYDSAMQWREDGQAENPLIVWYGIGPAEWTAERVEELAEWLGRPDPCHLLAVERVGRGRAFAIVSEGTLSPRAQEQLARDRESNYRDAPFGVAIAPFTLKTAETTKTRFVIGT